MASALSENPASVIHSLNLAHNTLDNQGNDLPPAEPCFPLPPTAFLTDSPPLLWLFVASRETCALSVLVEDFSLRFFIALIYFLH